MIPLPLFDIVRLLDARTVPQGSPPPSLLPPVSIDSRILRPGECFVAIRGHRHDGHHFIPQAIEKGAAVVVHSASLSSLPVEGACTFLRVEDTTRALQQIAAEARVRWGRTVVGITGSMGKTTTRDFAARLLGVRHRVFQTPGNLNNEYGVPLSLLRIAPEDEIAVLELGMNHLGEIRRLAELATPDRAVLTNVAAVHLEYFSGVREIAEAKAEILEHLKRDGVLFYNADDPLLREVSRRFAGRKVRFGFSEEAEVRILDHEILSPQATRLTLALAGEKFRLTAPFAGVHFLSNLAAAAAVAFDSGIPATEIAEAVEGLEPLQGRGHLLELKTPSGGKVTVWDDSYNSNPEAVCRILEAVGRLQGFDRKILVLGEMLELGDASYRLHSRLGARVAGEGPDLLVTVGPGARPLSEAAVASGLPSEAVAHFEDSVEAAGYLASRVREKDFVLVKGSRGVRTDRIVDKLRERFQP